MRDGGQPIDDVDDDEPRRLLPVADRSAVLSAVDEPPADGLEYLLRVRYVWRSPARTAPRRQTKRARARAQSAHAFR